MNNEGLCTGTVPTMHSSLPEALGTYALLFRIRQPRTIAVGRLGELELRRGWYIYVGSAFGPGGLRGRVGRHLRGGTVRHWHIDYLRAVASVEEVWYTCDPERREHKWAVAMERSGGTAVPMRFGASDCRCRAHLFCFEERPGVEEFADLFYAELQEKKTGLDNPHK